MPLLVDDRLSSGEVISVQVSGEVLAMVVNGGMRSFLGPALGALLFVILHDNLSRLTEDWLFWSSLLFVAFVAFSPTGLIGMAARLLRPWRKVTAAMCPLKAGQVKPDV